MGTYALVRIIGNELPPRDTPGNRIKSLKFILENEPSFINCTKFWVLNQIHDLNLKRNIIDLLKLKPKHSMCVLEFDKRKFIESKTYNEKVVAAINVNKARNLGIDISRGHDFVFVFDGDCFFTQSLWDITTAQIEADQQKCQRKYYGVPGVRLIKGQISSNPFAEKQWEPSIVFRYDAELRFNESIPFSQGERLELMEKIGYTSKSGETNLTGEMCKNVGCLLHVSFNEEASEVDLIHRMNLRQQSIQLLLDRLCNNIKMM